MFSTVWYGFSHLVAVMHGRDYLSEEMSCLPLAQASALTDVVIQLALAGVLHHNHNLVLVLKHWEMITKQSGSMNRIFSEYTFTLMALKMGRK